MKIRIIRDKNFYRMVLSIMLPVALQQAINMGVNMLDTMMLGSFGEIQLSASSLANQYYNFYTIFCMGIIGGSSVLAAQYWGAGDKEKVRETFSMAMRLALGLSVFFAVLTMLIPDKIMAIYTSEQEVITQGVRYLEITAFIFVIHGTGFAWLRGETFYFLSIVFGVVSAALVFVFGPMTISVYTLTDETIVVTRQLMNAYVVIVFFQAIQSVMTKGVLRGGGDTKFLMMTDILFMWVVSIPLGAVGGLILFWPAWLTMLCLRIDYIIKSAWCVSRLLGGKWIHEAEGLGRRG